MLAPEATDVEQQWANVLRIVRANMRQSELDDMRQEQEQARRLASARGLRGEDSVEVTDSSTTGYIEI